MASTFYTTAARDGGGVATMNFNASAAGVSSLVFGPPPPNVQWSQEIVPFPSKFSDWEFHASVFDLSVCGVNIMGSSGGQWPALIDTGQCRVFIFLACNIVTFYCRRQLPQPALRPLQQLEGLAF
jgi:hypothetical protein